MENNISQIASVPDRDILIFRSVFSRILDNSMFSPLIQPAFSFLVNFSIISMKSITSSDGCSE